MKRKASENSNLGERRGKERRGEERRGKERRGEERRGEERVVYGCKFWICLYSVTDTGFEPFHVFLHLNCCCLPTQVNMLKNLYLRGRQMPFTFSHRFIWISSPDISISQMWPFLTQITQLIFISQTIASQNSKFCPKTFEYQLLGRFFRYDLLQCNIQHNNRFTTNLHLRRLWFPVFADTDRQGLRQLSVYYSRLC